MTRTEPAAAATSDSEEGSSDASVVKLPALAAESEEEEEEESVAVEEGQEEPEEFQSTRQSSTVTAEEASRPKNYSKQLVRFLQFYGRFASTATGQDRLLNVLQYTLWLAGAVAAERKRRTGTVVYESETARALQKLSHDVSFARYATRLTGFPVALEAVLTDSWTVPSDAYPRLSRFLGKVLAVSMALYYPTEAAAWTYWMLPKTDDDGERTARNGKRAAWWSAWSCRFWCAYVVAEGLRNYLQWKEDQQQQLNLLRKGGDEEEEAEELASQQRQAVQHNRMQLARNVLFFLPCLHWSDVLPPSRAPSALTVNALMWLESLTGLTQSVRAQRYRERRQAAAAAAQR